MSENSNITENCNSCGSFMSESVRENGEETGKCKECYFNI